MYVDDADCTFSGRLLLNLIALGYGDKPPSPTLPVVGRKGGGSLRDVCSSHMRFARDTLTYTQVIGEIPMTLMI